MTPSLIHMMYFPWDEHQQLKANDEDFDHGDFDAMRAYAPDFEVRLWTYTRTRDFCRQHYPEIWQGLETCSRPVMMVDVLRWLCVYHFGGIYWQLNTTPLRAMSAYLPSPGKDVRLFTEFVLTPDQCQSMTAEPIRNGQPEESTRVLIQVFSAQPKALFVRKTIDFLLDRVRSHTPKKDYDILYITGNAAVSTAYDRFGKNDSSVELMDLPESKRMIKWHYRGSWRREAPAPSGLSATPPPPNKPRLDRLPFLGAAIYRFLRRHPHELMLAKRDAEHPRTSFLHHLVPLFDRLGIHTVFEAPCGLVPALPPGITYTGGDPNRAVVTTNQPHASRHVRFRQVNLLYSRFPQVDLFLCPDFLEWLSFAEGLRVLTHILVAKPRYLALTGCPLLRTAWDTALGDYRPINLRLVRLDLPEPRITLTLAAPGNRRSDQTLMVWKRPGNNWSFPGFE